MKTIWLLFQNISGQECFIGAYGTEAEAQKWGRYAEIRDPDSTVRVYDWPMAFDVTPMTHYFGRAYPGAKKMRPTLMPVSCPDIGSHPAGE